MMRASEERESERTRKKRERRRGYLRPRREDVERESERERQTDRQTDGIRLCLQLTVHMGNERGAYGAREGASPPGGSNATSQYLPCTRFDVDSGHCLLYTSDAADDM
eukprot:1098590-Rhodomonas_salina.1